MANRLPTNFSRAAIVYTWRCCICGDVDRLIWYVSPGGEYPHPTLPIGWRHHGHDFYCPKHELILMVDGKEFVPDRIYHTEDLTEDRGTS